MERDRTNGEEQGRLRIPFSVRSIRSIAVKFILFFASAIQQLP